MNNERNYLNPGIEDPDEFTEELIEFLCTPNEGINKPKENNETL